jgi:CRP-like cAMP-binding protein
VISERFLRDKRGVRLEREERELLDAAISEIRILKPRTTIVRAGDYLDQSTLLLKGFMSRYIDDRHGLRQLVAVHVPGDFVDLHGFPLKVLDHDVATLTAATVAIVPHDRIDEMTQDRPRFTRKLWFATLIDAAIHRAWLFRLGRLDAVGRVAHFLCETNTRLMAVGLSDGRQFELPITQSDLGEICGLSNVHVNRVMRNLREDRLCVFRSSVVEILDARRFAARGQFDPAYLYIDPEAQQPAMTVPRLMASPIRPVMDNPAAKDHV